MPYGICTMKLWNQECVAISDLAINGQDLIGLGMKPGKAMGMVLGKILEYVMEHPHENEKERLIYLFSTKWSREWNMEK